MSFTRIALLASIATFALAGTAQAATPATYLNGTCLKATSKPAQVVLYCGDGNYIFTKLNWSNWGQSVANAHGTLNVNTCTPNCAAGKTVTAKAVLTVSHPEVCGASHHRQYTQWLVTVLFTPPKGVEPNSTGTFQCK